MNKVFIRRDIKQHYIIIKHSIQSEIFEWSVFVLKETAFLQFEMKTKLNGSV